MCVYVCMYARMYVCACMYVCVCTRILHQESIIAHAAGGSSLYTWQLAPPMPQNAAHATGTFRFHQTLCRQLKPPAPDRENHSTCSWRVKPVHMAARAAHAPSPEDHHTPSAAAHATGTFRSLQALCRQLKPPAPDRSSSRHLHALTAWMVQRSPGERKAKPALNNLHLSPRPLPHPLNIETPNTPKATICKKHFAINP